MTVDTQDNLTPEELLEIKAKTKEIVDEALGKLKGLNHMGVIVFLGEHDFGIGSSIPKEILPQVLHQAFVSSTEMEDMEQTNDAEQVG
jgi:hypothetical protein